jgi:hypothetical protein
LRRVNEGLHRQSCRGTVTNIEDPADAVAEWFVRFGDHDQVEIAGAILVATRERPEQDDPVRRERTHQLLRYRAKVHLQLGSL